MLVASKADARKKFIKKRGNMPEEEVKKLSEKIVSTIVKLQHYKNAKTIMIYLDFNNEINIMSLIEDSLNSKKKVLAPFYKKEGIQLIPTQIKDINKELKKMKSGYYEVEEKFLNPINIEEIDLMIVPGLAFDRQCHRLGFGAGYYDKFLGKISDNTITLGVAYEYQILSLIPDIGIKDIPLNYVVTEKRVLMQ